MTQTPTSQIIASEPALTIVPARVSDAEMARAIARGRRLQREALRVVFIKTFAFLKSVGRRRQGGFYGRHQTS